VGPGDAVTYGPLFLAVPVAMAAGLVSFLSPCCLPLLPGYLAYVGGSSAAEARSASPVAATQSASIGASRGSTGNSLDTPVSLPDVRRARGPARSSRSATVLGTFLFVLGFGAVFTLYGAAFGQVGATMVRYQDLVTRVLGIATILLGLSFAGLLLRLPVVTRTFKLGYRPKVGLVGAPLLGVLFGIGWTPCVGPTLAAVLSLSLSTGGAVRGALLSFAYSLGLGLPFLLAASGASRVMSAFDFARRHALAVMRAGGTMLVLLGVLQVSGLWVVVIARLQGAISSWQPWL
jgi:cytochrome c-type biogenesis protein